MVIADGSGVGEVNRIGVVRARLVVVVHDVARCDAGTLVAQGIGILEIKHNNCLYLKLRATKVWQFLLTNPIHLNNNRSSLNNSFFGKGYIQSFIEKLPSN